MLISCPGRDQPADMIYKTLFVGFPGSEPVPAAVEGVTRMTEIARIRPMTIRTIPIVTKTASLRRWKTNHERNDAQDNHRAHLPPQQSEHRTHAEIVCARFMGIGST